MKQLKKNIRRAIAQQKQSHSLTFLENESLLIAKHIEQEEIFQQANTILIYYALPDEVQTASFIEKWTPHKNFILPTVDGERLILKKHTGTASLQKGAYNIWEPIGEIFTDFKNIDLAIIPGVAFDYKGNRLGRGKGFYDRLLKDLDCPFWGICYSFQQIDCIPHEEHDIRMQKVITSTQCL